jgi:hypothetical protein
MYRKVGKICETNFTNVRGSLTLGPGPSAQETATWRVLRRVSHHHPYDLDKDVSCWVHGIPTPKRAAMLLKEHGRPPEEE